MITTDLTEESRANLKIAARVVIMRIEPSEKRGDRWVISASLGERTTYLSDTDGIAMFNSIDAALKFIRAARPDLVGGVEVGDLVDSEAANRSGSATPYAGA